MHFMLLYNSNNPLTAAHYSDFSKVKIDCFNMTLFFGGKYIYIIRDFSWLVALKYFDVKCFNVKHRLQHQSYRC